MEANFKFVRGRILALTDAMACASPAEAEAEPEPDPLRLHIPKISLNYLFAILLFVEYEHVNAYPSLYTCNGGQIIRRPAAGRELSSTSNSIFIR